MIGDKILELLLSIIPWRGLRPQPNDLRESMSSVVPTDLASNGVDLRRAGDVNPLICRE